jgi:hypothetical protein
MAEFFTSILHVVGQIGLGVVVFLLTFYGFDDLRGIGRWLNTSADLKAATAKHLIAETRSRYGVA